MRHNLAWAFFARPTLAPSPKNSPKMWDPLQKLITKYLYLLLSLSIVFVHRVLHQDSWTNNVVGEQVGMLRWHKLVQCMFSNINEMNVFHSIRK